MLDFTIGLTEGVAWPWPIAVYLFLAGISGGAVAVAICVNLFRGVHLNTPIMKAATLIGFITIVLGMICLVLDLTNPLFFWRILVYYNPTSVIVMALLFYIPLVFVLMCVALQQEITSVSWLKWLDPIISFFAKFRVALDWIVLILAIAICAYTGFLISALIRFPLINTAVLPALFVASGFSAGCAATKVLAAWLFGADRHGSDLHVLHAAERYQDGPVQKIMAGLAKSLGIWIAAGTIPLKSDDEHRVTNTMLVYDAFGQEAARYDKIHLFSYEGQQERYDESELYVGGHKTVSFNYPLENGLDIHIGLAVCYDLRFPQLFRRQTGVDCFLLPAAFTTNTGKAHWEVLLRARAIENLSYVVAAAQAGRSSCGRAFWGHSCAVDPWGTVVGSLNGHETGVCFTDVDPAFLRQVRALLPALNNRVKYE